MRLNRGKVEPRRLRRHTHSDGPASRNVYKREPASVARIGEAVREPAHSVAGLPGAYRIPAVANPVRIGPTCPTVGLMDVPSIRPTFDLKLAAPPDLAMGTIRKRMGPEFQECTMAAGRCVDLFVAPEERVFWSPHLSVQLEGEGDGSRLHGRYAPHPEVWTLFVFLYAAFGFLALVGLGWGLAQNILGQSMWGLLLTPASLLAIGALVLGARYGQRRTRSQMVALRDRLDALVQDLETPDSPEA